MGNQPFEKIGLIPRSIIRTLDRFRQQLLPGTETLAMQEFRISRQQMRVSVKCLFTLIFVPLLVNFLGKTFVIKPFTKYLWNTQQTEIFLNSYQENRAFIEMQNFEEKFFFESLILESSLQTQTSSNVLKNSFFFFFPKFCSAKPSIICSKTKINFNNLKSNFIYFKNDYLFHFAKWKTNQNFSFFNRSLNLNYNPVIQDQIKIIRSQNTLNCLVCKTQFCYAKPNLVLKNKTIRLLRNPNFVTQNQVFRSTKNLRKYDLEQTYYKNILFKNKFFLSFSKKNQVLLLAKHDLYNYKPEYFNQIEFISDKGFASKFCDTKARFLSFASQNQVLFLQTKPPSKKSKTWFYEAKFGEMEKSFQQKFKQKTIELALKYNQQSIDAITDLIGDFITLMTIRLLFVWMKPQIIILKSFLTESLYSLSDTTKSILIILLTDLLVGYHSPKGWEFFAELVLRHYGFAEDRTFILFFIGTFPVLLDTIFKYWIFRHLNRISPSTVVTYHSMIE